jgi:predicted cupin superfamily sugar epimerase
MHPRAAQLIATLDLRLHPEGGFYREIYRSAQRVAVTGRDVERAALTTIYFLLAAGSQSRWHVVASDEVWHLYEGDGLEVLELDPLGAELVRHRLVPIGDGMGAPVHTVPAGTWQAARPLGDYALVGCTVAPGFEFTDFQLLADHPDVAASVRDAWPEVASLI